MADAVQYRAMQDVQAAIQGAITGGSLVGLSTSSVVLLKSINDRSFTGASLPAVFIGPLPESMPPGAGVNDRDDIIYNVLVALVDNDKQNQTANWEQELNWRQNVRRLFHEKQLGPLTTESVITYVRPLAVVHPEAWYANLFVSMLVVAATCREVRTQG